MRRNAANNTPPTPEPPRSANAKRPLRPPFNASSSSAAASRRSIAVGGVTNTHDARKLTASTTSTKPATPFTAVVVSQSPPIIVTTAAATEGLTPTRRKGSSVVGTASTRTPLHARDRNAPLSAASSISRTRSPLKPATAKAATTPALSPRLLPMRNPGSSSSSAMGFDKETPRKPTLASRPMGRAPLTPKIASTASSKTTASTPAQFSTSHSPYQQTVTVSTPLARRGTGLSAASQSREDLASPVPSYLNSNVTPRSGSRQSRVDSGNTTPNGTPSHADHLHWDSRSGLGISPASSTLDERLRNVAGAGSPLLGQNGSANANPDSKFFYASDAKSTAGAAAVQPSPSLAPGNRSSTFFYANGKSLPGSQPQQTQSTPTLPSVTSSPPDISSKFVHANGAALERPQPSSFKGPGSAVSQATAPPKLAASSRTANPQSASASQQRPLSPVKMAAVSPYPLQKTASFPVSASTRSTAPPTLPLNATAGMVPPPPGPTSPGSMRLDALSRQRSGFSASTGSNGSSADGHSRKGSLTIADPPTVARLLQSSQPNSETSSPASMQFPSFPFPGVASGADGTTASLPATSGLAAILQATEELVEPGDEDGHSLDSGNRVDDAPLHSPTKQQQAALGSPSTQDNSHSPQVDELVTNARRERKVQDLEITNASLEAINRSLERQLRKQKAELRQFRRLSRSGRLSLAPSSAGASRITSGSTVEGPLLESDRLLASLDEDGDEDDGDGIYDDGDDYASDMEVSFNEYDDDDDIESDDELRSSESDETARRQRERRQRDERRLQLDLSKHRQLLVDSQKINQSIKRCLNWTEALIQDGRKALAFQVRVSEVQLGGRVLAADEVEERESRAVSVGPEDSVVEGVYNHGPEVTKDDSGLHQDAKEDSKDAKEAALQEAASISSPKSVSTDTTNSNSNAEDHHDDNRNEAFSPVSHNIRSVRFDTVTDKLGKTATAGGIDASNELKPANGAVATLEPSTPPNKLPLSVVTPNGQIIPNNVITSTTPTPPATAAAIT